ncbi:MAG TPA: sigma-54 dependent transcriptional regulator [Dissulfurispiraceae bacterium]
MNTKKILIVDDDGKIRSILRDILKLKGFLPLDAPDGQQALELFRREGPMVVLLDLKMPGMDGIRTMEELKKITPGAPIIIITAHGDVPTAVEAIKLGAYDFILKPPDFDTLILTLNRAVEKLELEREVKRLHDAVETSFQDIFGKSRAMQKVIEQIDQVAKSDFSVIIQGETGTGKSFFARAIHNLSGRSKGPFITVDMGAIPEALVESELFGYEKGAFTGAEKRKRGYFEAAHGGTILIDELENMSPYLQSKLLGIVEERKAYALGSTEPLELDVRIIAATNADIHKAVREKTFREDLYYRLGECIITVPPLRERTEDVAFLSQKFLKGAAQELGKAAPEPDKETISFLKTRPWPGNVRELKNVMRRAVLFAEGNVLGRKDMEELIGSVQGNPDPPCGMPRQGAPHSGPSLREVEAATIKQALVSSGGNKRKASLMLQIDYTTLLRKIKLYGIQL